MADDLTNLPSPPDPPPTGVDNYQLGKEIATGGMGSVLEAEDQKLQRSVAIKVMLLEGNADEVMRQRFIREAQVLAMLAHPNIVPVHDIVWEDGLPLFYSMKLVKGRTLAAILTDLREEDADALRDYPLTHLLNIFRKVCDAIAFAHSMGVIHRDLKPENVMVGEFGEVLVMDWGLAKSAKFADQDTAPRQSAESVAATALQQVFAPSATLDGTVLGTPQYMSPEQAAGNLAELDERSDVYALGGILYAILTLRAPVAGESLQEVLSKVTSGNIIAPSDLQTTFRGRRQPFRKGAVLDAEQFKPLPHLPRGRVPLSLSSVTMKSLQLERDRRYASVVELGVEIEDYQSGFATSAEQAGAWKQLWLLMFRHRVFTASLAVLLLTSFAFVWKVVASERRAQASAKESQRSLAKAQLLLADTAFRDGDPVTMAAALDSVPESLRNDLWAYYSARRDSSLGFLKIDGFCQEVEDVVAVPHQPGQFAIASRTGKIGIVDVVSRKLLRTIDTGNAGDIRIAISGDGTRLLSRTGITPRCHLFETATGEKLMTVKLGFYRRKASPVFNHTIALNENGSLATFSFPARKEIRLFDMATGALHWTRVGLARQMLFHPDGKRLLVAREDTNELDIVDVANGQLIPDPTGRTQPVNAQSMSLSRGGKWMAASLNSGELVMMAMEGEGQNRRTISRSPIAQVAFTAGDNLIVMGGGATAAKIHRPFHLYEPVRANQLGTFLGLSDYPGYLPLRVNVDSGHVLTIQSPPQLWHIPDKPVARLSQPGEIGWSCEFLSDSILIARRGSNHDFYDVSDPQAPAALGSSVTPGHGITAAHPESGLFATAVSFGKTTTVNADAIKLSQFTPDGVVDKWVIPALGTKDLTVDLRFDARAERLVRVGYTGEVQVLSTATGETLAQLSPTAYRAAFAGTQGWVTSIEYFLDEADMGRVHLFDPSTGVTRASMETSFPLIALAVSPDLQHIAVAGAHASVLILDADTLEEKHRFLAHDASITALRFHPTRPLLATGSADHSIKIWEYATAPATLQQTFLGLNGSPMHLAFSPNGSLLVVDGMEYAVNIFAVDEGPK